MRPAVAPQISAGSAAAMPGRKGGLLKRSLRVAGHRTSISLEQDFWEALVELAARRDLSTARLVAEIDAGRGGNLSSAIRLFVLDCARRGELGVPEG